jgi:hypothetical protein
LLIGFGIGIAALLGTVLMFFAATRDWNYLAYLGGALAALGIPGIFVEAYISAALTGNPYSGSTPLGFLLVALPVNGLFYSALVYVGIAIWSRIRGKF